MFQAKVSRIYEILVFYFRLKRLDVSHNGISNIGESAFKGVGQLDYLNISFNSLREFKSNTFKGTVYTLGQ
jgi:Leucine-rich repeat (LRR) protein